MYQVFRVFSKLIKIIRFYLILNNLKNKLTVSLILSLNHATQCSFKSGKLLYVNFLEIPNVCILLLKSACICERWRTGPGKAPSLHQAYNHVVIIESVSVLELLDVVLTGSVSPVACPAWAYGAAVSLPFHHVIFKLCSAPVLWLGLRLALPGALHSFTTQWNLIRFL